MTGLWHLYFYNFGHGASSHIIKTLSQGELPAAPAGPGRDDRVQSGEAWTWDRGLRKEEDPVHQSPTEGDQRQPAERQPARVLPPGCHRQPQYLLVITKELSVQYRPRSTRCRRVSYNLYLSEAALWVSLDSSVYTGVGVTWEQQ